MAGWTIPRTAAVGSIYTSSWYNTDTRDNLGALQGVGVCGQIVGASTDGPGANGAFYVKVWARVFAVTSFEVNVAVSAGNLDFGVYTDVAGVPTTRLWSRGSVASPGTGQQTFLISAGSPSTLSLTGGFVWLAAATSSATANFQSSGGTPKGVGKIATSSFPLPATAASLSDTSKAVAAVLL